MDAQRGKKSITVLVGPARSGKSARVVELFNQAHRAGRRALILVPDSASATAIRWRLLCNLPAVQSDLVTTFSGLARRILVAGRVQAREIGHAERMLVMRNIVGELSRSGMLSYFSHAAAFGGLYEHLGLLIAELKACQIEPEDFRKARFARTARDEELAEIYARYQSTLTREDLYDDEGLFWRARLVLTRGLSGPWGYDDVLIDGFSDFTANEILLLKAFAPYAGTILATLPYEASRVRLFAKTLETLRRLKGSFSVKLQEIPQRQGGGATDVIARHFASGMTAGQAPLGKGLRIITACGARMEMEEVAREIKRLIRAGRKPSDIAVIVRHPAAYAGVAKEAFDGLGVPLAVPAALSLRKSRLANLLSALVQVGEDDFSRETVVNVLGSPYVNLESLCGCGLRGEDVARIARDAGIVQGYQQWAARLAALERSLERENELPADESRDDVKVRTHGADIPKITALKGAVTTLKDLISPLRAVTSVAKLAAAFRHAIESLGVRTRILVPGVAEGVLFRDLAEYAAIDEATRDLMACPWAATDLPARAFVDLLYGMLRLGGTSSGEISGGGVAFLGAVEARNLSFAVVFVCGVVADAFPSPLRMGPFYSRDERQRLAELGLIRRSEESHLAAERLLFYQAATRADEALYVTYPATDNGGRPQLASFYLDELKALFAFGEGDVREYRAGRAIRPVEEAATPWELAISASDLAGRAARAQDLPAVIGTASRVLPSFAGALRGAVIEARRESFDDFDRFDGILTMRPPVAVTRRFPPGHAWSGSQLSDYRLCPFRFFLIRILDAETPEEPDIVPSALEKGTFAHNFLAELLARMRDDGRMEQLSAGDCSGVADVFGAVFSQVSQRHERRLDLAADPFWTVEKSRLRRMLWEFVEDEMARLAKDAMRCTPAFFELAFGPRSQAEGFVEKSSLPAGVAVSRGGQVGHLCGRVDRIDLVSDGSEGFRRVCVVDYKLGARPTGPQVAGFVDMQMPVYLYAAGDIVPGDCETYPAASFYRTLKQKGGKLPVKRFKSAEDYSAWRAEFAEVFFKCIGDINSGFFAPVPNIDCPAYCPGRGICRYSETRVEALGLATNDVSADE